MSENVEFKQLCTDVKEIKAALIGTVGGKRGFFERVRRIEWIVGLLLAGGAAYAGHYFFGA